MSANTVEELTGADAEYGYVYGCEGLISLSKAAEFLGVHENTVRKYCKEGHLRKGKHPGSSKQHQQRKAVICRRSLREYIAKTEE